MKFKFHICCIVTLPRKLMVFGFTIHGNVRKLQISLVGKVALLYLNMSLVGLIFSLSCTLLGS